MHEGVKNLNEEMIAFKESVEYKGQSKDEIVSEHLHNRTRLQEKGPAMTITWINRNMTHRLSTHASRVLDFTRTADDKNSLLRYVRILIALLKV